jgi:hypothetical protein
MIIFLVDLLLLAKCCDIVEAAKFELDADLQKLDADPMQVLS